MVTSVAAAVSSLTGGAGSVQSIFGPVATEGGAEGSGGFGGVLKSALNQVANLQDQAQTQVNSVVSGTGSDADLGKVMISVEKADVAFQLMMQVRNKIVSAYQDIEKMQF